VDVFAPHEIGFVANPYPAYAELRGASPVVYDEATDHWLITRYADVDALLRDRRFGRTYLHVASHEEMGRERPPARLESFWRLINAGILDMEGTDHARVRRLVSKAFTPSFVEALRPRVEKIVVDLARAVDGAGEVDLRADHSLIPIAVEELLRFDTPPQLFERWVLEPFELHGVEIPRGAELCLVFGSANRDPEVFADPDRLDVTRTPNPHLTFGAGIHFCLGAPLGRMELQTSFRTLLERFPSMEPVEDPRWRPNYIVRGLAGLRVDLG
jgi:cytochrome P450